MQQRTPGTHAPIHLHTYIYIYTPVPGGGSFLSFITYTYTHNIYGLYWIDPTQNIVFNACFIPNNCTYFDLL